MRRVAPALLALLGWGCEPLSQSPPVPPLYISAQLVVGDTLQYIFVDRPRDPSEPRGRGLTDAEVFVSSRDTTVRFSPQLLPVRVVDFSNFSDSTFGEDSVWFYVAKFSPKPLTRYQLTVVWRGDTARGWATTPDTFSFVLLRVNPDTSLSPVDTVRLPQDTGVLAVWEKVRGAVYYYTFVFNWEKRDSITYFNPPRYIFVPLPDTSLAEGVPENLRAFPPFLAYNAPAFEWKDGVYAVKVWALDEGRYTWGVLDRGNLENAEGFFGAISRFTVKVPVRFVR